MTKKKKKKTLREELIEESHDYVDIPISTLFMMGWICPLCLRGVSPKQERCPCLTKFRVNCDEVNDLRVNMTTVTKK